MKKHMATAVAERNKTENSFCRFTTQQKPAENCKDKR